MTDSQFMVEVLRKRKVACVIYESDGTGKQLVLKADPGRVFVRFRKSSSLAIPTPYPGQLPTNIVSTASMSAPEEYKFKDVPAMVTGEWYIFNTTPGDNMEILTETYVGD